MASNKWVLSVKSDCAVCGKPISGIGLCTLCWGEWTVTGTVRPIWLYGEHTITGSTGGLLAMHSSFTQKMASREILILDLPIEIRRKI